jgi:hypothetical protein
MIIVVLDIITIYMIHEENMVKYLQMYLEIYVDTKNKVQDFYTNGYKNSNFPTYPNLILKN